jgi:DNA-binding MarR family transcriptional regulator
MNRTPAPASRREQVDFVSANLLPRSSLLVRLLVKQVHNRQISRTDIEALSTLARGPRRITELAELEGLAQPTMTLLIRRLEQRGWVKRTGLPEDARVVMVQTTEQGTKALARFRAQFQEAVRGDIEDLDDLELEQLAQATMVLGTFLEELQQRPADRL